MVLRAEDLLKKIRERWNEGAQYHHEPTVAHPRHPDKVELDGQDHGDAQQKLDHIGPSTSKI